ncbi:TetR family transcriptional regulator [Amycolatopsis sp. OK19-0408]|uniref:TetR family transcriptional regulator n=1 Tax=Amycolatopsis iheyensis TaxID=2945988 RepID=A0A9X2NHV3_9PSEU|nr:TetR family transcriptional regulator [Amycolatopsis iheyensis]MCR6487533.1 TetR family transcriptional regulator [Amycolatopsis iheyensis]
MSSDDLTARARIRDAALRQFGEHGFEGATIRGIAQAAGVSSGLLRHHFGSKQDLRDVCDAHLVDLLRRLDEQALTGHGNPVAAARIAVGPYRAYLARALVEGGAAALFDEMVELGARWHAAADRDRPDPPSVAPEVRAAVSTAMALSITVLHEHLSRALGVEVFSPEGDGLLARALIDLYAHPVLSAEDARKALEEIERHENP